MARAHAQTRTPKVPVRDQTRIQGEAQPKKKRPRRFYDYSLLFTIIFLTVFGLIMIYSSSYYNAQVNGQPPSYYMVRQAQIAFAGFVMMLVISKMNYHFFARFTIPAIVVSYVCMLLVNFTSLGIEVNGKKRWLGTRSLRIQPAELVKVTVILVLAVMITKLGKKINEWRVWGMLAALIGPLALLVTANNLSSGIIIVGIAFVMMFVACKRKWPFVLTAALIAAVILFAEPVALALEQVGILHEYQLERILVWKEPEAYAQDGGFQVLQGLYAIGSGGLLGKGLGQSIQKLSFLPEPQNDMIFAIICEELGLFGAVSVILIFLFMLYRFMVIAGNAPDLFGALLVVGVMAHIAIQVVLNIAVVTNVIPNTGITLPFISYGGTSVLFLMIEMGMVLSVSNQIRLES
ncbi:MAG TPA: cell division protein FtsW [Candidatus Copromonas avistercoris]|nr:cell division protein FtsW [Candidatus Copromonas avistercoris]